MLLHGMANVTFQSIHQDHRLYIFTFCFHRNFLASVLRQVLVRFVRLFLFSRDSPRTILPLLKHRTGYGLALLTISSKKLGITLFIKLNCF